MILELFALKNYKTLEQFKDASGNTAITTEMIVYIVIILIVSLIYTAGAISLSWNYNNYIGTSNGLKLLYAILVFIAPSIYYPFYALLLNPITNLKVPNVKRV